MKLFITLAFLVLSQIISVHASEPVKRVQQLSAPVIIDVRTQSEWDAVHHPDAVHIEWQGIVAGVEALQLAKSTPLVLYCRSGNRAGKAQKLLQKAGYSNVVNGIKLTELPKFVSKPSQ